MAISAKTIFAFVFLPLLFLFAFLVLMVRPAFADEPSELCPEVLGNKLYLLKVDPENIPTDGILRVQFIHLWAEAEKGDKAAEWQIWARRKGGDTQNTGETLTTKYLREEDFGIRTVHVAGAQKTLNSASTGGGEFRIEMRAIGNYKCSGESNEFTVGAGSFKDPAVGGSTTIFGMKLDELPAAIAERALQIAIGVAGGVAFLLMVFGSYRLIFAGGNPEAIQQGREIITAAIAGLLVIVFSVFILQLVGISILGLNL
jgi:hypothetical protein